MKLRYLLLGTACALGSIGAANAAITTPTGWYLSMAAGANWVQDGDVDFKSSGVVTAQDEYSWDAGYAVVGAVGYDFGDHWRGEFEVAYRHNKGDSFCTSGGTCGTTDAGLWELSQMVNVFYDISLGGNWEAAVGAGVGGNLVVWDEPGFVDTEDYVLAGQLIAQAAYRVTDRWQFFLDYRFMFMNDPEFTDADYHPYTWDAEKSEHTLSLGVRFDLQRDGAAPAPEAPPAQPAKGPKQFIVFFGFDKSNLTPEAARVVADAAAAAKEYGSASIAVVGHTDTSGSDSYNQALSMRRSQSVKDGLVAQGIPASMISTSGRGESELMVQTGNGIKEPQNRRTTMDLN